jgi:hypothetical protein
MTNKEIITEETNKLDAVRQELINYSRETGTALLNNCLETLRKVTCELREKIKDVEPKQ